MARNTLYFSAIAGIAMLGIAMPAIASEAFATRNVNIRSGPGINFEIVDQLVKDEPVDKRNCNPDGSWCYISHEGPGGWVAAVFLTDSLNAPEPPAQTPTTPSSGNDYYARSQVNVRTGPGTQFAVVDRLEADDEVKRGQCTSDGKWCYVDHAGNDGWVSASFLVPINSQPSNPPSNNTGGTDDDFTPESYIARSAVNVRSGPGTNFSAVDRLERNERVTRNQCLPNGSWCYITHQGPDGWVAASFLYPEDQAQPGSGNGNNQNTGNSQPPVSSGIRYGTAITGMPVRTSPSLFTGSAGRLERGQTVAIDRCSSDGYWCHVTLANVQGWVPAAFLDISEPQREAPPQHSSKSAITTKRVFLREGPALNFGVVGTINEGSLVEIERCNAEGNWCRVSRNNRTGWITTSYLELPPESEPAPEQPATPNSVCFEGLGGLRICLQ